MHFRDMTICLSVAAFTLAAQGQQKTSSDVQHVELCDVVHNPQQFAGKKIGFEASVVTERGKAPMLISFCSFGIRAVIDDTSKLERNVTALSRIIERGPVGTGHTDVSGTFIGTFEVLGSDSNYRLHLDRVDSMTIKRY